jgi:hypothetical protein
MRERVHAYLGGAIREEGGVAFIVNGVADHVHIAAKLRQDKTIAKVVGQIKANSSGWISRAFPKLHYFEWQEAYAAFTVSQSQLKRVQKYVETQEEHHCKTPYITEFKRLLKAHEIPFDERYLD